MNGHDQTNHRAQISVRDAIVSYVGAWLVGNISAGLVLGASGHDTVAEAGPAWLVAISIAQWLPFLIALWMLAQRARGAAQWGLGDPSRDYGLSFRWIDLLGLPIGVAAQLAVIPLLYWPLESIWPDTFNADDVEKRARELWESASGSGIVLLVLVVVVGAPLVEELIYRGLLQGAVGRRLHQWHGWLAVTVIAALFSLVHFSPIEYPGLFLVGLILGGCARLTGRLGMSVVAHFAFNATALILVARS